MFDIQSKYKKLILTDFSMELALLSHSMLIELYHWANADALRCQYDT